MREKSLLNQLEDAKGVLSIQGRKLEESDAEKSRLRDLVEHANLKYVHLSSQSDVVNLSVRRVQGLTRDLQVGIPKSERMTA